MAEYNTRGQKHNYFEKDFDYKYNKGYAWNPTFDKLVKDRIEASTSIKISYHINTYDKNGNRTFDVSDINSFSLMRGEVVEIETECVDINDNTVEVIRKALIRLPEDDGEQIVAVVLFEDSGRTFVKTAYLNKVTDNHEIGLDLSDIDWRIEGIFGVVDRSIREFYLININGKAVQLKG